MIWSPSNYSRKNINYKYYDQSARDEMAEDGTLFCHLVAEIILFPTLSFQLNYCETFGSYAIPT